MSNVQKMPSSAWKIDELSPLGLVEIGHGPSRKVSFDIIPADVDTVSFVS